MSFGRFQGLSRLTNWFYSATESDLLNLEERTREVLSGLLESVQGMDNPPRLGNQLTDLVRDFRKVSRGTYDADDYEAAERELQRIFDAAERLSYSISSYDIPLSEGFNASQEAALAPFGLKKDSSLADVVEMTLKLANRNDLADVPAVRELLDVLGQWVTDALIKAPKLSEAVPLKGAILEAAAGVQEAYLTAFVRGERKRARGVYGKAILLLAGRLDPKVLSLLAEATLGQAYPKVREASTKPYDTASMMLAQAFLRDGFAPELVVGLPTGGVHAATRVVASLAILGAPRPRLWATRPQGVKEESKAFMKGAKSGDILSPTEVDLLRSWKVRTVAIVDDGFESGGTLVRAKEFYGKALKAEVRTGVIEASTRQMGSEVRRFNENEELETISNPADYVVVAGLGVAGPTGVLADVVNRQGTDSNTDPRLRGKTTIVTSKETLHNIKVGDLLGT